jgi:transmembrane sensor
MSSPADFDSLVEQAAAFHARIAASDMTADEWRDLELWMRQDPDRRAVFESMGSMSDSLASLAHLGNDQSIEDISPGISEALADSERISTTSGGDLTSPKRGRLAVAAGLLVALVVPALYFVDQLDSPAPTATVYRTKIAERMNVELDDGSFLAINADSRVSVTFSGRDRRLFLERGEIDVNVVPDASRPFHVGVGNHLVTAVGTAFVIQYRDEPARVTVREGRVQVAPSVADPLADPVELSAGQRLVLASGANPVDLSTDELLRSGAWRDGWMHFKDERLDRVIRELKPYFDRRIVITDARAAGLEVGGSFNVDKAGSVLATLESLLPISITDDGDKILIKFAEDTHRE